MIWTCGIFGLLISMVGYRFRAIIKGWGFISEGLVRTWTFFFDLIYNIQPFNLKFHIPQNQFI